MKKVVIWIAVLSGVIAAIAMLAMASFFGPSYRWLPAPSHPPKTEREITWCDKRP